MKNWRKAKNVIGVTHPRKADEKLHPDYLDQELEPPDDPPPNPHRYHNQPPNPDPNNYNNHNGLDSPFPGQQSNNYIPPPDPRAQQQPAQNGYSNHQSWSPPQQHYPYPVHHQQSAYANTYQGPQSPSYPNSSPPQAQAPLQNYTRPSMDSQHSSNFQFPNTYMSSPPTSPAVHDNMLHSPPLHGNGNWSDAAIQQEPQTYPPPPERALMYRPPADYSAFTSPNGTISSQRTLGTSAVCQIHNELRDHSGRCPVCSQSYRT
ncbi:hypothetical protein B0J11DRAFT_326901 [Dendryphion nanum]|uniref:Uncharacterized protein n=1 Tax=Dendryphion nanum TaxID=256645 RepID=A0A9P9DQK4_9PLEO|nr:hypothetical protein B0J11DRAFT_326901 [Dendryphion nanum]